MSNSSAQSKTPSLKKDLVLFLSIPLTVIVIVAAILQGPSLFAHPHYSFLYSVCPSYSCSGSYTTSQGGKLAYASDQSDASDPRPMLYYLDTNRNSSQQISLPDAQLYKLDTSNPTAVPRA